MKDVVFDNAELVVVSDVHLRNLHEQKANLLFKVLEEAGKAKLKYLVLLGDIFDFFLGSNRFFQNKYKAFSDTLEALGRQGTKVIYFEGNHEFDLKGIPWQDVEIVTEGDKIITLSNGAKIKFAHGDLVYSDWSYRLLRFVVKSGFVRFLGRWLPGKWIEAFALMNAHASRYSDNFRTFNHEKLLSTADKWATPESCDHAVIGHFHMPYAKTRGSGRGKIFSVDSWDKPNLLVYKDNGFKRFFLHGEKLEQWEEVEPQSIHRKS